MRQGLFLQPLPTIGVLMEVAAGEEEELVKLVERLNKASTAYSMEISAKKTNGKQHQWHQHRD